MKPILVWHVCETCLTVIANGYTDDDTDSTDELRDEHGQRMEFIETTPHLHPFSQPVPPKFKSWEEVDAFAMLSNVGSECTEWSRGWKRVLFMYWTACDRPGTTAPPRLTTLLKVLDREGAEWLRWLRPGDLMTHHMLVELNSVDRDGCFGFSWGHCECCGSVKGGVRHAVVQLGEDDDQVIDRN